MISWNMPRDRREIIARTGVGTITGGKVEEKKSESDASTSKPEDRSNRMIVIHHCQVLTLGSFGTK
jgi:hypothetical protein